LLPLSGVNERRSLTTNPRGLSSADDILQG
jgi:hypothetical protein